MNQSEIEYIERLNKILNENPHVLYQNILHYIANVVPVKGLSLPMLEYLEEMNIVDINIIFSHCCKDDNIPNLVYLLNNHSININETEAMTHALRYNNLNVINFLIENGYDIESNKDKLFRQIIFNNYETLLPYFLNLGLKPSEKHLRHHITNPNVNKIFIDYGVDPDEIAKAYFEYLSESKNIIMQNLSMLSTLGIDLCKYVHDFSNK